MEYLPASEAATTQEEKDMRECNQTFTNISEIGYIKKVSIWNELEYGIYRVIMFVARMAVWAAKFIKERMGR